MEGSLCLVILLSQLHHLHTGLAIIRYYSDLIRDRGWISSQNMAACAKRMDYMAYKEL